MAQAVSGRAPSTTRRAFCAFLHFALKTTRWDGWCCLPTLDEEIGLRDTLSGTAGDRGSLHLFMSPEPRPQMLQVSPFLCFEANWNAGHVPLPLSLCRRLCSPGGRTPRLGAGGTEVPFPYPSVGRTVRHPPCPGQRAPAKSLSEK